MLNENIAKYKDNLDIQGVSQIDYSIKHEVIKKVDIVNLITNFEKSLLWRQGKFDDIKNFNELFRDRIEEFCVKNDVKLLTVQSRMQTLMTSKMDNQHKSRARLIL